MNDTVELLKSGGISGPQDIIFLIRYASLAGDKELLHLVGETLREGCLIESSWLIYALVEYYEATGDEFAKTSAEFFLPRCGDAMTYNKAARVFQKEEYLSVSQDPLALIELYKATFNENHLKAAEGAAALIEEHFSELFDASAVYDINEPSANSCIAVLFDELARLTQSERWLKARERQNRFIRLLHQKYPTNVSFGLCALLGEEFGEQTIVVEGQAPEALLHFYAPTTALIVRPGEGTRVYVMKDGKLKEIMI